MRRFLQTVFLFNGGGVRAARMLERAASLGMVAMVLLSFMAVNLQALLWQSSDWLVSAVLPAVVVDMTNREREALTEAPLLRNALLDAAASLKANDMANGQYFAHYSPAGVTPWHWFDEVGYTYAHAGENLAIHFSDSSEVVEAWMKSPTHRANIINGNYTEIGVGTARGTYQGYETVFVVQLFGTPANPPARTSPIIIEQVRAETVVATDVLASGTTTAEVAGVTTEPVIVESYSDTLLVDVSTSSTRPRVTETVTAPTSSAILAALPATTTELVLAAESAVPAVIMEPTTQVPQVATASKAAIKVAEVVILANGTTVYSDFMATSSGLPAIMRGSGTTPEIADSALVGRLATQPNLVLQILYSILGSVVGFMLLLALLLGWRSERPWRRVYGALMLALMVSLVSLHLYVTTGALIS